MKLELAVRYQLTILHFSGVRGGRLRAIQRTFAIKKEVGAVVGARIGAEKRIMVGEEGAEEDPRYN